MHASVCARTTVGAVVSESAACACVQACILLLIVSGIVSGM